MRCLVTGGAGFIGSNLVDGLLAAGHAVTVFDAFSTGRPEFLPTHERLRVVEGDVLDLLALAEAVQGHDAVVHLAANADVRHGPEHPRRDLEQNTIATHNVLEAMRSSGVKRIVFSSTGAVYGDAVVHPTPENCPMPVQTSLYGASKLAAEGLITAYASAFGMQATIFRFVSILGERYTHGHVVDFYRKLLAEPTRIEVLGDGRQRKSYLYVQDCVAAMLLALQRAHEPVSIFNLGTDEFCTVDQSLGWICDELGLRPRRVYTGGDRGWVGDSPFILLDCARMRGLGWRPTVSIEAAVRRTLWYLREHPWLLEERGAVATSRQPIA
ncbi:MAG: NAD-dependent epimerase/dehydratase family protein [Chloroflexi bacterium]|nr:NAD-dependent epimerase/dehydratase family protein [Chloroflexota bacterium]